MKTTDKSLTVPEVQELLQVSRSTVYELFEKGLRSFKVGRCRRVNPTTLQEFIRRRES